MRKGEQEAASSPYAGHLAARLPGLWQAAFVTAMSALVVGYWTRPLNSGAEPLANGTISRMAEVTPQDVSAALDTMSGTREQLAQFREQKPCSRRLAWLTISAGSDRAAGKIRLQSGNYISPAYDITAAPVRIALPYPAPYGSGHGTIAVLGTTADALVALTPSWHVPTGGSLHARDVTWIPASTCPGENK